MVKQVIVIRKDLKMRRGKEIAQGAHASMAFLLHRLDGQTECGGWGQAQGMFLTRAMGEWLEGQFTKVCLQVDSEAELVAIHEAAKAAGLESNLITDAGATEFHDVPTKTCLAIGPDEAEKIDAVTRHLKLY